MNKKNVIILIAVLASISLVFITGNFLNDSKINKKMSYPVEISASVTNGEYPLEVSFSYDLTGFTKNESELFYFWDFGDGHYSIEPNATHVYEKVGKYDASLIVSYESYIGSSGIDDANGTLSNEIKINVEKQEFKLSGEIVNNYNKKVDFKYAYVYDELSYWSSKITIKPNEEKSFNCIVEGDYDSYYMWAQWFHHGTNNQGCNISKYYFSNQFNKDMRLYVKITSEGKIKISNTSFETKTANKNINY